MSLRDRLDASDTQLQIPSAEESAGPQHPSGRKAMKSHSLPQRLFVNQIECPRHRACVQSPLRHQLRNFIENFNGFE